MCHGFTSAHTHNKNRLVRLGLLEYALALLAALYKLLWCRRVKSGRPFHTNENVLNGMHKTQCLSAIPNFKVCTFVESR